MASRRASELIDQLLARQQQSVPLEKHTRLPYGWAIWLRARGLSPLPHPGPADVLVQHVLGQPLPGPEGRLPALSALQAFRRLFWQGWERAPADQRWMRWSAAALSFLLHLLFALALVWVAMIRPVPVPAQGGDGERVQVEFLGQGTQPGGAPTDTATPAEADAPSAAASATPAQTSPVAAPTASAEPAAADAAAATAPSPPQTAVDALVVPEAVAASSPLQATQVNEASSDFVVPPMTVPHTEVRAVAVPPVLAVRERSVQPLPSPQPVQVAIPTPAMTTPTVEAPQVQVREREVAVPMPSAVMPALPAVQQVTVPVPGRELAVREREVQMMPAPSAPALPTREVAAPALPSHSAAVRERSVEVRQPAAATGRPAATAPSAAQATATAAAAARPASTPGNWATPARGDDWGASSRNRAGASDGAAAAAERGTGQGLFNADGSVRVAGAQGQGPSERGAPGGDKDGWSRDRIAASGTWLKRPPYDYTPTSFDKYWVPNESLLAEWVRKGIKAIEIPLPGSGTKISCVISVLQFGGGCGLTDPNMQDQPAEARPPPDVPYKPEYQEGNAW